MGRTYYHTCEKCGANLDPGEKCTDCDNDKHDSQPDTLSHDNDNSITVDDNDD